MRVVITGGHHTPALAVIEELYNQGEEVEISWIGHRYSMWGDTTPSAEYKTITSLGIPFYNLKAGKFHRNLNLRHLIRIPIGFLQAFYYLFKIRPAIIISFGGYLALPVVIIGWLLSIPAITHEQTTVAGWANRVIARFVKTVFISWPESAEFFPEEKTVLVGNPIRSSIFESREEMVSKLEPFRKDHRPTIYVTGGKQGSHSINEAVREELKGLLEEFNIIHQCGGHSRFSDRGALMLACQKIHNQKETKTNYLVQDYFGEDEIGAVLEVADFVVSRSGANTVYELAALGKPAIFIPLPGSSHAEQEKNAQLFVKQKAGLVIDQDDLAGSSLLGACETLAEGLNRYKKEAQELKNQVVTDAGEKIANSVFMVS